MSRKEKLVQRFLMKPKDFRYSELKVLLEFLGFQEIKSGTTAGSRIAFCHEKSRHIIRLHRPHPGDILKSYQIEQLIQSLKKENLL